MARGLGFRVLEFRVQVVVCSVEDFEFRVWGLGSEV